ncbi:hypothetical protein ACRRTK_018978 [Alexandromys fortis]
MRGNPTSVWVSAASMPALLLTAQSGLRTVPGPSLQILSDFEAHKTKTKRVPKKKRKRCWVLGFHYWILTGIGRDIRQA